MQQVVLPTIEPTVGSLLAKLNIKINKGDVVEPAVPPKINQDDFGINIYRAVPVLVVDGTSRNYTCSAATTPPRLLLRRPAALSSRKIWSVRCQLRTFILRRCRGEQVTIDRATPVTLNLYDSSQTGAHALLKLLVIWWQRRKFEQQEDQLMPLADTPLTPGQQITLLEMALPPPLLRKILLCLALQQTPP